MILLKFEHVEYIYARYNLMTIKDSKLTDGSKIFIANVYLFGANASGGREGKQFKGWSYGWITREGFTSIQCNMVIMR